MRFLRPRSIVLASLLLSVSVAAQQPAPRDPQAVALLASSFAAMEGQNLPVIQDTQATVQLTVLRDRKPVSAPATLKTLGKDMLRVESESLEGKSVFVMNGQGAAMKVGFEEPQRIPRMSVAGVGITHVPVLSILADWADPGIKLEYLGAEKEEAGAYHHVRMQRRLADGHSLGEYESPCDIYLDPLTFLVAKLVYSVRPPANLLLSEPIEVHYGEYRNVSGILVPFHVTYTLKGQLLSEYRITSFAVNQRPSETDFEVK